MMWSPNLTATYLDQYISPRPMMSNSIQNQLLMSSEANKILVAMEHRAKGEEEPKNKYGRWLSYSGIEPKSLESTLDRKDGGRCLLFALFNLALFPANLISLNWIMEQTTI